MTETTPTDGPSAAHRALVADDDEIMRGVLEALLGAWGYDVVSAADGEAAWAILQSPDRPRICLLDWMMPGLSGIELCRRIRANPDTEGIYVLMLTGRHKPADLVEGLEAGADEYLVKPFDETELRARLNVAKRVVRLEESLQQRLAELEDRLEKIRTLEGLVPICMYCKNVRDEADYWSRVEQYVEARTGAQFSHGICPTCMEKVEKEWGLEDG